MNTYTFTQPVSMQVNQEQFDFLKPKLEALGYKVSSISGFKTFPILATKYAGEADCLSNISDAYKFEKNRHFIDHYNPELFLAIAAMTDAEYGIAGEHWVLIKDETAKFKIGKVYKANKPLDNYFALINDIGVTCGRHPYNLKYFRRATLPELISHYTKPKTDMSTDTRNVQISLEQAKALYEGNKEQYGWLLTAFPELEQPKRITWEGLGVISGYFIGDYSSILHAVNKNKTNSCNRNIYRTEAQARGALAQSMITQLLPVYNGADWVADWNFNSPQKYFIAFDLCEWRIIGTTTVHATILTFKDKATAERFLTEQTELLEQYKGLFIEPKNS